ncbi:MAG: hypothetical protein KDD22_00695, partial [Bdellovibrionales bacterium]|nr:hypothetical protein [Bdellovibrionales bacterium]
MKWILTLIVALSAQVSLASEAGWIFNTSELTSFASQPELAQLDWKVGDRADYLVDMGFLKGTLVMHVREWVAEGPWIEQNIEMMGQKQKVEILFDKNDGSIITMIVNGQKQEVPKNNSEIEDMKEAKVTVPAGTFDCIYVKIKDLDKNQSSEAWINPQLIPIAGMLQQKAPSQFG